MHRLILAAGAVLALAVGGVAVLVSTPPTASAASARPARELPVGDSCPIAPINPGKLTLPEVATTAVIPELLEAPASIPAWTTTAELSGPTTVYNRTDRRLVPVGTLQKRVAWGAPVAQPVIVIASDTRCGLSEILTGARQMVPGPGKPAAAQTAAWIMSTTLRAGHPVPQQIRIHLATHTLSIVDTATGQTTQSFPVVTGAPGDTPTPTVTTYVLSTYIDPRQAETDGLPILLSAAHSPLMASYDGNSGQIAVHYMDSPANASSHGCIRVGAAAGAQALGALPTGTPIIITEN